MTTSLRTSIDALTETFIKSAEDHFRRGGATFDRIAFCENLGPTLDHISETAHFIGAEVFDLP